LQDLEENAIFYSVLITQRVYYKSRWCYCFDFRSL